MSTNTETASLRTTARERASSSSHAQSVGASRWIVRDDADFLNSLCNLPMPAADRFDLDVIAERAVAEAFKDGFKHVRRLAEVRVAQARLNGSERRLWDAISFKTLHFGKLLEKIPHRFFTHGQIDRETGELAVDLANALPVLPPAAIGKTHIKRGTDGLLRKRMLTRVLADPHPLFGSQAVYSPLPIYEAMRAMVHFVEQRVQARAQGEPLAARKILARFDQICGELDDKCPRLFSECNAVHEAVAEADRTKAAKPTGKPAKLALVA